MKAQTLMIYLVLLLDLVFKGFSAHPALPIGPRIVGAWPDHIIDKGNAKLPWQARVMYKMLAKDFRGKTYEDIVLTPVFL
jgi:hypothetical protein